MNRFKCRPTRPLPEEVVADFEAWVKMGAPDPRGSRRPRRRRRRSAEFEKRGSSGRSSRPGWSKPPAVKDAAWPKTDIDRFLLAALEAKGLEPGRATPIAIP